MYTSMRRIPVIDDDLYISLEKKDENVKMELEMDVYQMLMGLDQFLDEYFYWEIC